METETPPKQSTQQKPKTYEKFPLKPDVLKGLKDYGCLDPFAAKENILLPILDGKDLYAEAETCFGKMLAIIVAALQLIKLNRKYCQVLIIMPTRELCIQAVEITKQIGKHMNDLNVLGISGGTSVINDRIKLSEGPSILISTPGRLLNVIEREFLELKWLKLLVLDEADEILGRGFEEQILRTLKFVPSDVQVAIISGTTPSDVQSLINLCLRDPVYVKREAVYMDLNYITHYKVSVEKEEDKIAFLREYYHKIGKRPSIIFCKKVEDLQKLVKLLKEEKFSVGKMDHSMSQEDRWKAAHEFFRSGEQILVTVDYVFFDEMQCTQSTISLIINYDVPERKQDYQKNFGIMKRFSRRQTAINLVTPSEVLELKEIENSYDIEIQELSSDNVGLKSSYE